VPEGPFDGMDPPGSVIDYWLNPTSRTNAVTTTTIAVDLAKSVFEVAVIRHRFTRAQFERFLTAQTPAHLVMEAWGTAHFWA
jgi:hypothetical protein